MKKDINEILSSITPETPLEELRAYCDTEEDLELLLKSVPISESDNSIDISPDLKQRALEFAKATKEAGKEITTATIQTYFQIGYPKASAIYKWLSIRELNS